MYILLPLLLLLSIPGAWLLKTGLWPRRRGMTPHCGGCGYNLTGLTGERCPECGRGLERGIVYGERRRSLARTAGGAACLLPVAFIAALILVNINWYRLAPTFLLISGLQSKSPVRAWDELDRRIQSGTLSLSQVARVVDIGLKTQVSATTSPIDYELMNQLGQWAADGLMPDAQAKTFYDQMAVFGIRVRPKVVKGRSVPLEITHQGRAPSNLRVRVDNLEVLIDGETAYSASGGSEFNGRGSGTTTIYPGCEELGAHQIEARLKMHVYFGHDRGRPLHERKVSLRTPFELVAPAPEYDVRLKPDPALREAIRQSIRPTSFELGRDTPDRLSGTYSIEHVPTNVAFEVFVRVAGKEHRFDELHAAAGESKSYGLSPRFKAPPFTKCDLIFRSSAKVAQRTLDMYEIWDGELVYLDIPVKLGPYATSQPATTQGG